MPSIRDRILGLTALIPARLNRDLDALAAGLNAAPAKVLSTRYANAQNILSECTDGSDIISRLNGAAGSNSTVKYVMLTLVQDKGLNVGDPTMQALFDTLATGVVPVLTTSQASQLKNMAMLPQLVTRSDVEAAMYNPNGTEK